MALTPPNSHGAGGTAASPDVVVGNVAAGVADAGAPVKVGGKYSSTKPTLTDGQRGDVQVGTRGSVIAQLAASDSVTAIQAAAPADALSTSMSIAVLAQAMTTNPADGTISRVRAPAADGQSGTIILGVGPMLYNGSTVDRQRANEGVTLLASAARTATTSSADQTNYNGKGVLIVFECTAETGATDVITLTVQGKDSISGLYYNLITGVVVYTAAADTPTVTRAIALRPGVLTADAIGAGTANLISQKSVVLPRTWRATITPSTADSHTYSLSAVTLL